LPRKQWQCEGIKRSSSAISEDEFKIRLAEIFELLVNKNSQQRPIPAFSKDQILLQAPKTKMGGIK
jgi:hypothetical protein